MDQHTWLDDIARQTAAIREMQQSIPHYVSQARLAGHSWAAIGKALGTSKQAAWQLYGPITLRPGSPED